MEATPPRLFPTFQWAVQGSYSNNPAKAGTIEQLVRANAAKPGSADSRGAYSATCSTEHETLSGDRWNHVTVVYRTQAGVHITTRHVVVPKQ